ncbi:MAG: hypothetical protein JST66_01880 [Bacteroidetes bacterium]|nr:hypothetical protein [Bacteroidota bacterium]
MALTFGLGPQRAYSKGGKSKVDHRWSFGAALNYNLPTGRLDHPAVFRPEFSPTNTNIAGGFSYKPSFSYSLRIGYDRSFTRSSIHGFTAGIGLTDRKRVMQFKDYIFFYHGITYTQNTDRYIFDDLDWELRLAYRFRKDRTSIQLGALGLIRNIRTMHIYELDGSHYKIKDPYWWNLRRWYPAIQINYRFLTKEKFQFDAFIGGDRRMLPEEDAAWWDIQMGVQVSLVKQPKRKR